MKKGHLPKADQIKTLSDYDFVDLGAGDGGSLVNIERIIGGKGIGVEFSEKKVEKAVKLKRNVYLGDALELHRLDGKVDYVTCDNFLEHLLSKDDVEEMIKQTMKVARKFLYIRHPSFDEDEYLAEQGLKTYWSHWTGHTATLKVSDFIDIFHRLGITTFKIVPVAKIKDSNDDRILPLDSPIDQFHYEPKKHGKKPKKAIKFTKDVYYAYDIIAIMPGQERSMPSLQYKDQLGLQKHPKFSFPIEEKIQQLQKDLQIARRPIKSKIKTRIKNSVKKS